jgi:SAM-dependent methyltransferase
MDQQVEFNTTQSALYKLKELLKHEVVNVIDDISPHDSMFQVSNRNHYFSAGQSALCCIKVALLIAEKTNVRRILDIPCGYGRVLRTLKAAFPEANVTGCDIEQNAVDFCAHTFGATPVYSHERPDQIVMSGDFDLIWCGSLLTHLEADRWPGFLSLFRSLLAPGGVVVFTTHGRFVAERLRSKLFTYGLPPEVIPDLLEAFDRNCFAYNDYPAQVNYGISLSLPSWVCTQLGKLPALRLLTYMEQGWNKHQDVVACVRVSD